MMGACKSKICCMPSRPRRMSWSWRRGCEYPPIARQLSSDSSKALGSAAAFINRIRDKSSFETAALEKTRTVDIIAALWPERCKALVSVSGYLTTSLKDNLQPLPPTTEYGPARPSSCPSSTSGCSSTTRASSGRWPTTTLSAPTCRTCPATATPTEGGRTSRSRRAGPA